MRLRSAQLGGCAPCSASRKDESITEDEVACLIDPERAGSDAPERLAIRLVDLMAADHHAVDDGFLRRLAEVFTVEEIVELSWSAGILMGGHRFLHVLDALGDGAPVVNPVHV